jgi:hypothetical protein
MYTMEQTVLLTVVNPDVGKARSSVDLLFLSLLKSVRQTSIPTSRTAAPFNRKTRHGAISEEDILKSYQPHANCYIIRQADLDGFLKIVKNIDSFWRSVVKVPHEVLA